VTKISFILYDYVVYPGHLSISRRWIVSRYYFIIFIIFYFLSHRLFYEISYAISSATFHKLEFLYPLLFGYRDINDVDLQDICRHFKMIEQENP
jgi:hypothetical protein